MIRWYLDIMPCRECIHSGYLSHKCFKEHKTEFADGCSKCGKLVNYDWYYNDIKCPDFDQRGYSDPSGS